MDSITQAALGAAMGEAVVGKKMRNRAILWGAWAGTIPDLDVITRLFLDHEVYGLLYHRGLTHSIIWTIAMAPLFGFWAYRYYAGGWHKKTGMQVVWLVLFGLFTALIISLLGLWFFTNYSMVALGLLLVLGGSCIALMVRNIRSVQKGEHKKFNENASWKQWSIMFFLAFLTHWLIDAGTSYGTQIFEPFSNYRISFNNISIVDFFYTGPLLIGLLFASFAQKTGRRRFWNGFVGIGLSTLYMGFSFYSKSIADNVFEQNLAEQGIEYNHYVSSPTIANTILWQVMVESDTCFHYGLYSLLDEEPKVNFIELPKNHDWLEPYKDDEKVKILTWFAQDYYNITKRPDGSLQFNQLRFGLMGGGEVEMENPYIFTFVLKEENGELQVDQMDEEEVAKIDLAAVWDAFWTRLKGI